MIIRASTDQSISEDWATPVAEQEPIQQQSTIDPQLIEEEQLSPFIQAADDTLNSETIEVMPAEGQPSLYPLDGGEGEFGLQDADAWLADLERNEINWLQDIVEIAPSPPT